MSFIDSLPEVRGLLVANVPLKKYTWLRVGGEAEVLFVPKDETDLAHFLSSTSNEIPVTVLGAASNLLVGDSGVKGVVIKLGGGFSNVSIEGSFVRAGAAALDSKVAKKAALSGISGLEFYAGIPGTVGGALRMNAGCYGSETKDVLVSTVALDRSGRRMVLNLNELKYSYRHSGASNDLIYTEALFKGVPGDISSIHDKISEISDNRNISQPIKEKTGGSTFKNPDKKKSKGLSAWELIDAAGGRGLKVGGAQMSQKHCNFMINTGEATAADFECLGNEIVSKVKKYSGVELQWEIQKIGNF
ncbi:MAG: UDP-N-acetylmuramate dehydrogenase [Hellea sp.]|jgi:UDP-N-acetylmuramate dehydrogenase|nr:UDP-N-acetylmuramate dehydrogenase [Hellea sp.]MBT4995646.1 UDP-N-acetylmuramate dehydrogenase [Hellea sp.]MBT5836367.1 UDP-N-acetylmuramate dehydrogenase [Hellea sp.]MBT7398918.1 UDP-N-acetylmuramate dehydrogenase [Hellea sp.]MDA8888109.1 UDP-N-acetylmuramate dehydrogenase [Hellea sp.]MDB4844580.1 UDP-N-acetylmuramate dehydrogenase [Hellea sp.]